MQTEVILPNFHPFSKKIIKKKKNSSSKTFTTKCQKIIISIWSFKSNIPQWIYLPSPPTHRLHKLYRVLFVFNLDYQFHPTFPLRNTLLFQAYNTGRRYKRKISFQQNKNSNIMYTLFTLAISEFTVVGLELVFFLCLLL